MTVTKVPSVRVFFFFSKTERRQTERNATEFVPTEFFVNTVLVGYGTVDGVHELHILVLGSIFGVGYGAPQVVASEMLQKI